MRAVFRIRPCIMLPYRYAILSGILIGTSYIPFPPWAVFFCFVPLWAQWLKENSYRGIFWTGWTTQFVLTLIGFNWVSHTVHEFGHLPMPIAFLVLMIFCSFAHLHIPIGGILWHWLCRKLNAQGRERFLLLPVCMSAVERLFPMIFEWHMGYTWLWAGFPAYHIADVVGFSGLSTIGMFINLLILSSFLHLREKKSWWKPVALAAGIFVALNVLGLWRLSLLENPDRSAKMLLVQANIGNQEKLMAEAGGEYRNVVFDRFLNETRKGIQASGRPDYVVWPETAFPEVITDPSLSTGFSRRLKDAVTEFGSRLITGGYSIKAGTNLYTNSFFAIDQDGTWADQPYHKSVLLAFGEYIPFGDVFPKFYDWLPYTGHFGRGPGPSVLKTDGLKIGAQICYEGLFDWFTRGLARKGAEIIVNVTNDSWYGTWQEPYQHLYMTLARAIEVRRPLVRSTNTGISTVVAADGKVMELSPLQREWFHLYEVPYLTNPPTTPFMTWGYWLFPALFVLTALWTVWKGRISRR